MELAATVLKELPRDIRNISGLTLGISQPAYEKICKEIDTFQNKILSIAEKDESSDEVFQLNIQMFPVSMSSKRKKTSLIQKKIAVET